MKLRTDQTNDLLLLALFFFSRLTTYFKVVDKLSSHPLVLTCSQVTPLLLDTFFCTVKSFDDENEIADIVKALIGRISLLFNVSEYADTIHRFVIFSSSG